MLQLIYIILLQGVFSMKINLNNFNYKILIELLNGHLDRVSNMSLKDGENLTGKQEIPQQSITKLASNKILNLLHKMNTQDRQLLLSYLFKNNLPLDSECIQKLMSYLQNKADTNNNDLIKAFVLLMKNNIPINKGLLEGIASNLNQEKSLSNKLNDLINIVEQKETSAANKPLIHTSKLFLASNQENQQIEKDNPIQNILKQLIFNPSRPVDEIIEQLKEYPEKLKQGIQLLQEQGGNREQKILQQLIGQQIINHQDRNLLLQLEIPLFFSQYKKNIPAFLSIKQNVNKKSRDNNSGKNYKIDFIISLEKRGIIKAETYISTGRVKISFTCNQRETMKLIESEFFTLKENLESLGVNIEKPTIEYSNIKPENLTNLDLIDETFETDKIQLDDFLHIDIKV